MMDLGKVPPQSVDTEKALLGAILLDPDLELEMLRPEHFYSEQHITLYKSISSLRAGGGKVDLMTVSEQLKKDESLEIVGLPYLMELTDGVGSSAHAEAHAKIIIEKYILREIIKAGNEMIQTAYQDNADPFDTLNKVQSTTDSINDLLSSGSNEGNIEQLIVDEIKSMTEAAKDKGLVGVPSGFKEVDQIIGGWQKSDLVIVAGRPAMGKTAFMLSIARASNVNVGIASLEMSKSQLTKRVIASATEVEMNKIKDPKLLTSTDWETIYEKVESETGVYITDTAGMHVNTFRSWAKKMQKQHDCNLFIVDYLQLMKADASNREQEISAISRTLKQVAKELNCPVISLAQLNRKVEERQDKRPNLGDLRESGAIEQDADIVSFLYRPAYYGLSPEAGEPVDERYAEFIIGKHRNGSTGVVPLRFMGEFVKFTDNFQNFKDEGVPF